MVYYKVPVSGGSLDYPAGSVLLCAYPFDSANMYCEFERLTSVGSGWVEITADEFNSGRPAAIPCKAIQQEIIANSATISGGNINLDLPAEVNTGTLVKFLAPCACTEVTGWLIIDGATYSIVDALGNTVTGSTSGSVWDSGSEVSVVIDTINSKAYIQNSAKAADSERLGGKLPEEYAPASNQNLLDNWYFVNPVNQRGKSVYTSLTADTVFTIDRWGIVRGVVSIFDDHIELSRAGTTTDLIFSQTFENKRAFGKTCTFSIKEYGTNNLYSVTGAFPSEGGRNSYYFTTADGITRGVEFRTNLNLPHINLRYSAGLDNPFKIEAVKLELGTQQTLAHHEGDIWVLNEIPNYSAERAKCQRIIVSSSAPSSPFEGDLLAW